MRIIRSTFIACTLVVVLAGAASASSWSEKCATSSGHCPCCALAMIEIAFASLGGW